MNFFKILLFFFFFISVIPYVSTQLIWNGLTPAPTIRYAHTAIYTSSNNMLVFGGFTNVLVNDLWNYNFVSNEWTQLNASNPPSIRYFHTAIYTNNNMIVFGGFEDFTYFNDLYLYVISNNTWIQLNASNPPSGRYQHTSIYQSANNNMIVFGGQNSSTFCNDLWEYVISSNGWGQLNPGGTSSSVPFSRAGHTALYESSNNNMIIFAGWTDSSGGRLAPDNDLWLYSFSTYSWSQISPSGGNLPPSRYLHSGIYDDQANSMIIFGGKNVTNSDGICFDDSWQYSFSANTWNQINPSGNISSRCEHSAIYNDQVDSMVIFGGYDCNNNIGLNDVWEISEIELTTIQQTTVIQTTIQQTTATQPPEKTNSNSKIAIIIGASVGGGVLLIICIVIILALICKRTNKKKVNTDEFTLPSVFIDLRMSQREKIGGKYFLVKNINKQEASDIEKQTGFIVNFYNETERKEFIIGEGSFGKILFAFKESDGQYVIAKEVKGERKIKESMEEANMQKDSEGPNILPIYNTINLSDRLFHFMPVAGLGNVRHLQALLKSFQSDREFQLKIISFIAKDILIGLQTIHKKGIIHLDLKPENLVLTKEGITYITDFGLAKTVLDKKNFEVDYNTNGDSRYFSPDRNSARLNKVPFNGSMVDLWATGLILLELLYDIDNIAQFFQMPYGFQAKVEQCNSDYFQEKFQAIDIFQKDPEKGSIEWVTKMLLEINLKKRITGEDALNSKCFKSLKEEEREILFNRLMVIKIQASHVVPGEKKEKSNSPVNVYLTTPQNNNNNNSNPNGEYHTKDGEYHTKDEEYHTRDDLYSSARNVLNEPYSAKTHQDFYEKSQ